MKKRSAQNMRFGLGALAGSTKRTWTPSSRYAAASPSCSPAARAGSTGSRSWAASGSVTPSSAPGRWSSTARSPPHSSWSPQRPQSRPISSRSGTVRGDQPSPPYADAAVRSVMDVTLAEGSRRRQPRSRAELLGEVEEVGRDDVPVGLGREVGRLAGAEVGGAGDERRAEPAVASGREVVVVGGDQHHLGRPEPEEADGGAIHLGPRLVPAGVLRGDDAVPRQPGEARQVDHAGEAAVRKRREDESGAQAPEPRHGVGPGMETPPHL